LIAGKTESLHIYPTLTTALNYSFTAADFVAFAEAADVTVSGTAQLDNGGAAVNAEVGITLFNEGFTGVLLGDDLNGWIANLPAGLSVKAKADVGEGSQSITLVLSGTPTEASSEALSITIPAEALQSGKALTVRDNPEAKFAIGLPAATAAVGDVSLAGEEGRIFSGNVTITLTNETFTGIAANADLSAWFTGLPGGLSAAVQSAVAAGAKTLTIAITGTPTAVSAAAKLSITIPATALSRGTALAVTDNPQATITINENSMAGVYIAGSVGPSPSTGKYWKYTKDGSEVSSSSLGEGDSEMGIYTGLAVVGDDVYLGGRYSSNNTNASRQFVYEKNGDRKYLRPGALPAIGMFIASAPDDTVYMATRVAGAATALQYWKITPDADFQNPTAIAIDSDTGSKHIYNMAIDDTHIYLVGYKTDASNYRVPGYWKCSRTTPTDGVWRPVTEALDYDTEGYTTLMSMALSGDFLYLAGQSFVGGDRNNQAIYIKVNKNTGDKETKVLETEYESSASAITVSGNVVYAAGKWKKPAFWYGGNTNYYGTSAAYWTVANGGTPERHVITDRNNETERFESASYILDEGSAIAVDGSDVYIAGTKGTNSGTVHTPIINWQPVYWKSTGSTLTPPVELGASAASGVTAASIVVR
jgi:hypothetical protein